MVCCWMQCPRDPHDEESTMIVDEGDSPDADISGGDNLEEYRSEHVDTDVEKTATHRDVTSRCLRQKTKPPERYM